MADSLDVVLTTSIASETISWAPGDVYTCADAAEKARFLQIGHGIEAGPQVVQSSEPEAEAPKQRKRK